MIGGEVTAREIHIDELFSNALITTTELVEIKNLKGSNNKFVVDPTSTSAFKEESGSLKEKINQTKKLLEKIPKQLENKKSLIDKNKQSVELIKEKITELKSEGKTAPVTFMGKLRDYQQLVNEYNALLKSLKDTKFQLQDLQEELKALQSKIFSARIVNHSPWQEYNEIKFRLISPAIEIQHMTKEHEISKVITLVEAAEGNYRINRSSEYTK
jgi:chromosome segregation ATPase